MPQTSPYISRIISKGFVSVDDDRPLHPSSFIDDNRHLELGTHIASLVKIPKDDRVYLVWLGREAGKYAALQAFDAENDLREAERYVVQCRKFGIDEANRLRDERNLSNGISSMVGRSNIRSWFS